MRANAPRGRITGSSSRPVAVPSRNSSRLATIRFTPKCCASGRITCSSPWLTSTTSAPACTSSSTFCTPCALQLRLQLVLEILLAQQVKAVAGNPAQHGVHHSRGKLAVRGVEKRAQQRHQKDEPAPPEALSEGLRVPGKECHRRDHRQVEQAAFHPPEDAGGRTGVVVWLFQNYSSSLPAGSTTSIQTKLLL